MKYKNKKRILGTIILSAILVVVIGANWVLMHEKLEVTSARLTVLEKLIYDVDYETADE